MNSLVAHLRVFRFPEDYEQVSQLWRSMERGVQFGRSDTPEEIQKKIARDPDTYIYGRHELQPTGELVLVLYTGSFYEHQRFKDGAKPLEAQLPRIVERIRSLAATERQRAIERQEEQRRYKEEAARAETKRQAAEKELTRLRKAEQAALQWERAERLRRYAEGLEARLRLSGVDLSRDAEWSEKLSWLNKSADWLDPLVDSPWPEVDNAPAPYWWSQYQHEMGVRAPY